jgi:hypothetical protein
MSLLPGAKRALHKQPEQLEGWYWEPEWCSESLFVRVAFEGPIHDPFCGQGRIVRAAPAAGYEATGSDLCDRGFEHAKIGINFLEDWTPRKTLVFNPPSPPWDKDYVDKCIAHALHVASRVAAIVAIPYLAGQAHYWMFYRPLPPALVLVHSERPSMPPVARVSKRKAGRGITVGSSGGSRIRGRQSLIGSSRASKSRCRDGLVTAFTSSRVTTKSTCHSRRRPRQAPLARGQLSGGRPLIAC